MNEKKNISSIINQNIDYYKTPCYVIDKKQFLINLSAIQKNFQQEWGMNVLLGYSVKTNHFPVLLQIAKDENMMAEAVSDDEYFYALSQGYDKKSIIFNGPQKSEKYLINAIKSGSIVNIDNLEEIGIIEKNYKEIFCINTQIGLRVNFDLEELCIGETTAGKSGSRFGLSVENGEFEEAVSRLSKLHIKVKGLHLHYSTKTRSLNIFEKLAEKACEISKDYGLIRDIQYIDIGGGFWGGRVLENKPTMDGYSKMIACTLKKCFDPDVVKLILEPGASLLATAITYYSRVKNVRWIKDTSMVTIDGSILHINPFLFEREPYYKIYPTGKKRVPKQVICGSTCMEMDRMLQLENEPGLTIGDFVQIDYIGAYSMAFNNCFINTPPYVYLKDGMKTTLVRDKNKQLMFDI